MVLGLFYVLWGVSGWLRCCANWLSLGQSTAKAVEFYNDKIKGLDSNLKDLAKVVQSKDLQLKAIEDGKSRVYRHIPDCRISCPNGLFSPETKGPQWRSWGCRRWMRWCYNVRYRSMHGCPYVQNKKKNSVLLNWYRHLIHIGSSFDRTH